MRDHLGNITEKLNKIVNLRENDYVLDIASNDATLLNSYKTRGLKKLELTQYLINLEKVL